MIGRDGQAMGDAENGTLSRRRDCALFYKSLAGTGVNSRSISDSGS
jgi:hypothetical protein